MGRIYLKISDVFAFMREYLCRGIDLNISLKTIVLSLIDSWDYGRFWRSEMRVPWL